MEITAILISHLLLAIAHVQSDVFRHHQDPNRKNFSILTKNCAENEILDVVDYREVLDISSLIISSCASVKLEAPISVYAEQTLTSIKIENVKNLTSFAPTLLSEKLGSIELLNIGYITEIIGENTFNSARKMDRFEIRNTTIGKYDLNFADANLRNVIFESVCIQNFEPLLNLSDIQGGRFEIINCYIVVTKGPVHIVSFDDIKINNSTIEFKDANAEMLISGDRIVLLNNNIINASINVTGKETVIVNNTCGNGSTMRVHAPHIQSHKNHLWGGITHRPPNTKVNEHDNSNCTGGGCKCSTHSLCTPHSSVPEVNNAVTTTHPAFFLWFTIIASFIDTRV